LELEDLHPDRGVDHALGLGPTSNEAGDHLAIVHHGLLSQVDVAPEVLAVRTGVCLEVEEGPLGSRAEQARVNPIRKILQTLLAARLEHLAQRLGHGLGARELEKLLLLLDD